MLKFKLISEIISQNVIDVFDVVFDLALKYLGKK